MEVGGYGYIKPELVKIAEEIYECRGRIKEAELELSEEQFHYEYISIRKNLVLHEVIFRLIIIIPITLLIPMLVSDIFWLMTGLFLTYFDVKLMIREARMIYLLLISLDIPFMLKFTEKYDLKSFQRDRYKTSERISWLQGQIEVLNQKISDLVKKRREILEEDRRKEEEEKKELAAQNGADKFKLKQADIGIEDAEILYEYYTMEERYINNYLIKLDGQMQRYNKEILEIDEDFLRVKQNIIIFLAVFLVVIILQRFFSGILYSVTAIICFLAMLAGIFYMERICKAPILKYLVEHGSKLTKEYAFLNNVTPVKNKRRDLQEKIDYYKKDLLDIKKKKAEIDIS